MRYQGKTYDEIKRRRYPKLNACVEYGPTKEEFDRMWAGIFRKQELRSLAFQAAVRLTGQRNPYSKDVNRIVRKLKKVNGL